ncbi:MAG: hypothetical protein U0835_15420 [Isosphaeraceae bacterium]
MSARTSQRRRQFRPDALAGSFPFRLEERVVLSTYTWTGRAPGADPNWSNPANWVNSAGKAVAPNSQTDRNITLVFPRSGAAQTSSNDDIAGLVVSSIRINNTYTIDSTQPLTIDAKGLPGQGITVLGGNLNPNLALTAGLTVRSAMPVNVADPSSSLKFLSIGSNLTAAAGSDITTVGKGNFVYVTQGGLDTFKGALKLKGGVITIGTSTGLKNGPIRIDQGGVLKLGGKKAVQQTVNSFQNQSVIAPVPPATMTKVTPSNAQVSFDADPQSTLSVGQINGGVYNLSPFTANAGLGPDADPGSLQAQLEVDGPILNALFHTSSTSVFVAGGANAAAFAGRFDVGSDGHFQKRDAGTLVLANTFANFKGDVTVLGGTLMVTQPRTFPAVSGLTVQAGATLDVRNVPVTPAASNGVTLNDGSTLAVRLDTGSLVAGGPVVVKAAGSIQAGGNVTLVSNPDPLQNIGPKLSVKLNGPAPAIGSVILLVRGSALSGIFAGLPNGQTFTVAAAGGKTATFKVNYGARAVVLTAVAPSAPVVPLLRTGPSSGPNTPPVETVTIGLPPSANSNDPNLYPTSGPTYTQGKQVPSMSLTQTTIRRPTVVADVVRDGALKTLLS